MSKWIKRVCWFGAVALAVAFGQWLATQFGPRTSAQVALPVKPALPIEATSTDFGNALETSDFAWTVGLRNTGLEDIEVVRVATSCDCLQATPSSFRLPEGGAPVALQLSMDLTRKDLNQVGEVRGREFQTYVRLTCKRADEEFEYEVRVRGAVRDLLAICPGDTNVGEHSILSLPLSPFRLNLQPVGPHIQAIRAEVASPTGWIAHAQVDGKSAWRLMVTPPPTLALGPFDVPITLTIDTGEGTSTFKVALHGRIVDDIELTPAALTFSPATVGTTATETLFLRSRTQRPVRIDQIAVSDPACTTQVHGAERAGWSIVLHQKVTLSGVQNGLLTLTIVDGDGKQSELRRGYRYYGR